MTEIQRLHSNGRLSEAAVYNGLVYLAGQVPENTQADAYQQTKEVLGFIDKLLAETGSAKHRILNAQIFLADMQDYADMNRAWDEWVDKQNPPTRATVEAKLANADWKVEIVVVATVGA